MEIKQLTQNDTQAFCDLIVDMYSNLENLEWFSPMPYDYDNVSSMISNERFYIIGAFENDVLCGVCSLDYKCGKLIGKIDFPKDCDTSKLVEIGFNIVHSKYRGRGIMKIMVSNIMQKIHQDGFEWAFAKIHKDNCASFKSVQKLGFDIFTAYQKPVKCQDFISLSSQDFFSPVGKQNAKVTLSKLDKDAQEIIVDYNIWIKPV